VDALHSHSEEQLEELFGSSTASEEFEKNYGFDDEEVLEQYRIMAQHDAISRVKENTGFDMAEYEKKKKMQGEDPHQKKKGLTGGGNQARMRLPQPKRIQSLTISTPKPEEPDFPPPKFNTRFLRQSMIRVPELCQGISILGGASATVASDEHNVRCLGCRCQLRVKILATLVSCPDCGTVSSASSTRR
jgi:predicted RNA-binding Zn-ribbon protein involved in translation (DUF1610 family)